MMTTDIIIFFGEMGGGKNYWGSKYAAVTNREFFDGDTVAPPEMVELVSKFKPLNREMLKNYIHVILKNEIVKRATKTNLVVAQALYLDEDRLLLKKSLEDLGFKVNYCWVKTSFWRNLKQIWSRNNGWRWVIYWLMNKPFFQKPTHPVMINYETLARL